MAEGGRGKNERVNEQPSESRSKNDMDLIKYSLVFCVYFDVFHTLPLSSLSL